MHLVCLDRLQTKQSNSYYSNGIITSLLWLFTIKMKKQNKRNKIIKRSCRGTWLKAKCGIGGGQLRSNSVPIERKTKQLAKNASSLLPGQFTWQRTGNAPDGRQQTWTNHLKKPHNVWCILHFFTLSINVIQHFIIEGSINKSCDIHKRSVDDYVLPLKQWTGKLYGETN